MRREGRKVRAAVPIGERNGKLPRVREGGEDVDSEARRDGTKGFVDRARISRWLPGDESDTSWHRLANDQSCSLPRLKTTQLVFSG